MKTILILFEILMIIAFGVHTGLLMQVLMDTGIVQNKEGFAKI